MPEDRPHSLEMLRHIGLRVAEGLGGAAVIGYGIHVANVPETTTAGALLILGGGGMILDTLVNHRRQDTRQQG